MAEAILNRLGLGKFKAYSAGSYPTGEVNPACPQVLRKSNFDVSKLPLEVLGQFAGPGAPNSISCSPSATTRRKRSAPSGQGSP